MTNTENKSRAKKSYYRKAFLGRYPYNLLNSGNLEKYYETLTNFKFLKAKINDPEFGVQSLIEDYDLIDDAETLNYPEYYSEKIKSLKLIQGALRLSAHILAIDKQQLASQLHGRLLNQKMPEDIQTLLAQIKQEATIPWLRLLTPSLTSPGGRLLRTLIGHSDWVKTVAVTPNGKQIISGSKDSTIKVWNLQTGEEQFTLTGHRGSVNAVAVTPDGKRVISGSSDGNLKIWNLATGRELITVSGHNTPVVAITVTPDSKWVISVSELNIIKVWSLESGKVKFNLVGHTDLVRSVAVTPNGKCLISGSDDTTIKVWDLETGRKLFSIVNKDRNLYNSADKVYAVAVTPNGKQLISGSSKNTIRVWNLEKPKKLLSLKGHSAPVIAIAVTPDSKQVVSASLDKTLKCWNLETGREIFSIAVHDDSLYTAIVTPDGKQLISGSKDKTLKVWDLKSEEENLKPRLYNNSVSASVITADNKYAIFSLKNNILKVWNLESLEEFASINEQKQNNCISGIIRFLWIAIIFIYYFFVRFSPLTFYIYLFGFVRIWSRLVEARSTVVKSDNFIEFIFLIFFIIFIISTTTDILKKEIYLKDKNNDFETDELPVKLLGINSLNEIFSWKLQRMLTIKRIESLYKNVPLILMQKKQDIFVINVKRILKFYNIEKLQIQYRNLKLLKSSFYQTYFYIILPIFFILSIFIFILFISIYILFIFIFHWSWIGWLSSYFIKDTDLVTAVVLTPNGEHLIEGSTDNTIKVWKLKTRKLVFTLKGHTDSVTAVAVTPDGKYLISGSKGYNLDNMLKVWNLETRKLLFNLTGHKTSITAITVTNDGKQVISGSSDKTIKVWDLESRKELFTFRGHTESITTVKVTPKGKHIISTSDDKTLHIWDLESQKVIASFTGESALLCCSVAPDGVTIVAGEQSGRVHFLRLDNMKEE